MAETKVPKLLHKMSVTAQKAWYARNKMPLPSHLTTGSVAKASKEVKPSERVKKLQTTSLKAYGATKGTRMGGDDGSGEEIRDTVAPLTRDQHSKVQAAKRAAKAKEVLDTKEKRLAFLKKLSVKPAPTPEPEDFDDEGHSDNMDVHRQLHVRGVGSKYSMDESTMNEVTKKEAEKVLGGSVKPKAAAIGGPGQPKTPGNLARSLARRAMKGAIKKEEVEVTEAVKDAADVGEYDYEGDMAKSQLRSILTNAKRLHDMLEDTTNLPEWVQSKITLAQDYILTAASYMEGEMNEEVEQVNELKKSTMASYVKKAAASYGRDKQLIGRESPDGTVKNARPEMKKSVKNRLAGINRAAERLAKEEVDTGEVDARKTTPSSKEKQKEVFAKHKERMKELAKEEVVTEAEGKVAVTPKEKELAAHHGDKTRITFGDVLKARLKSVAAKKMGKE